MVLNQVVIVMMTTRKMMVKIAVVAMVAVVAIVVLALTKIVPMKKRIRNIVTKRETKVATVRVKTTARNR